MPVGPTPDLATSAVMRPGRPGRWWAVRVNTPGARLTAETHLPAHQPRSTITATRRGSGTNEPVEIVEVCGEPGPVHHSRCQPSLTNASNASSRGHWVTLPDAASTNLRSRNIPDARLPGRSTR